MYIVSVIDLLDYVFGVAVRFVQMSHLIRMKELLITVPLDVIPGESLSQGSRRPSIDTGSVRCVQRSDRFDNQPNNSQKKPHCPDEATAPHRPMKPPLHPIRFDRYWADREWWIALGMKELLITVPPDVIPGEPQCSSGLSDRDFKG